METALLPNMKGKQMKACGHTHDALKPFFLIAQENWDDDPT